MAEHRRVEKRALEGALVMVLFLTVLDTAYLSWRYLALHAGIVARGTGLCSWTSGIDCDEVLTTPQARAFYVPNATLGFGFFFGCLLWWWIGTRAFPELRRHVVRTLAFWLGIATLFTLRFWWLLISLAHLCPFCPWNHLLTWIAFALTLTLLRHHDPDPPDARLLRITPLVMLCVGQFFLWQLLWAWGVRAGMVAPW